MIERMRRDGGDGCVGDGGPVGAGPPAAVAPAKLAGKFFLHVLHPI